LWSAGDAKKEGRLDRDRAPLAWRLERWAVEQSKQGHVVSFEQELSGKRETDSYAAPGKGIENDLSGTSPAQPGSLAGEQRGVGGTPGVLLGIEAAWTTKNQ